MYIADHYSVKQNGTTFTFTVHGAEPESMELSDKPGEYTWGKLFGVKTYFLLSASDSGDVLGSIVRGYPDGKGKEIGRGVCIGDRAGGYHGVFKQMPFGG